jgi:glycosyltransferase involved in cell wall biosynthesis
VTVLFGHPTGNPNSHHAALAHFEAGWLEAFCLPWMPTARELRLLELVPGLKRPAARLRRRSFDPLRDAPKIQGRCAEWWRMARRLVTRGQAQERFSYEANDWLMEVMQRECTRPAVSAVHSYEDCSLAQFRAAAKAGKSRIYDLPIGYYPAWERTRMRLAQQFADWLPAGRLPQDPYVRPEQKRLEMELADLVLVPSSFVERTVLQFTDRRLARACYGVDTTFWRADPEITRHGPMRYLYAGQCSLRKGTPLLITAWTAAALPDAILELAGPWQLAEQKRRELPPSVELRGPLSAVELRERFACADLFVFPSYFEGFGLVVLEAMACGLPVLATASTAGPDVLDDNTGRVIPTGDLDALIEALRWARSHHDDLAPMRAAARNKAQAMSWARYRASVRDAVKPFV